MKYLKLPVIPVVAALLLFVTFSSSCRRINFLEDGSAMLAFSRDTVKFDTVFTTIGSATRSFKIYNTYNQSLLISSLSLSGGENSYFRMNVDGIPGTSFTDIEIPPNDSIYVFVEVTVDPTDAALPYVVEDSIRLVTNNNEQFVQLVAWGQNAHFFDESFICDEIWENDLPYVIYKNLYVDSLCTLTIKEGCRIYLHGGSTLYVLGSLKVEGESDSLVTFQGDRLESFFDEIPGQWVGISFLRGSVNNSIRYAKIFNAINGVMVGLQSTRVNLDDLSTLSTFADPGTRPDLDISNSYIYDCSSYGIIAVNAEVTGTNLLVYNIGENNLTIACGGVYDFKHCTLANYGSTYLAHQNPVLSMSDFISFGAPYTYFGDLEQADFTNCIVYGTISEGKEILLSNEGPGAFNYQFDHCVLKTELTGPQFVDCQINVSPLFAETSERNYCPDSISTALNAGIDIGVPDDLLGTPRPYAGTLPDIGCYETYVE